MYDTWHDEELWSMEEANSPEYGSEFWTWGVMDEQARSSLLINRVSLVQDLMVDDVMDALMQDAILREEDKEIILHEKTSRQRAAKLLDLLPMRGPMAFDSLLSALEVDYEHLATLLRTARQYPGRARRTSLTEVNAILLEGGIPPRPAVYINRPDILSEIRQAFYRLLEQPGWVLVHGMGGSGKSVLAAEAIRCADILSECFPGGVFWLPIGSVDKPKLLIRMQNLCSLLDKGDRNAPNNIDEAKGRLRLIFARYYPRSLLILDDVWNQFVTKAFDIQCRIMVTTRDATVTDRVTGEVEKVAITSGFSKDQSDESLATWTQQDVRDLPDEAAQIYSECKGSPLAISMIGALLKDRPNRWKYYLKLLQKRKMNRLKKTSSYEYESLQEAVSMSINNLPGDVREFYEDFAVFDDDMKIPTKVLCILWDEEVELVEDIMSELVNKSLAYQKWDDQCKSYVYSIHDLQLDYLKEHCVDIKGLHQKLIGQYRKYCGGEYHRLPQDNYIHWFIGHHLYKAEIHEEMAKVFFDLRFVEAKLAVTGPADIINDYIKYAAILNKQNKTFRDEFAHFISINAHFFTDTSPDVIQLALCQPDHTEVYRQAKALAKQTKTKMYFDWCNKESVTNTSFLTTKLHRGAVYRACFTPDGSKVVSCSVDSMVKIFATNSGQELYTYDHHDNLVNCCAVSPNGLQVLSCSDDKTVQLWTIPDSVHLAEPRLERKNSKDPSPKVKRESWHPMFSDSNGVEVFDSHSQSRAFRGHSLDVLWCAFSSSGELIVSCGRDMLVQVWRIQDGELLHSFVGHSDVVNECCFSDDSTLVASCSNDMTVKLWSLETGKELHTLQHHSSIVLSCCFKPGSHTVASCSENVIKLWDAKTQTEAQESYETKRETVILCCTFSPNGEYVAAGLSSYSVQVWDAANGDILGMYRGHTGWVYSVAFSPDSKQIVSSSDDETVMIWDVENCKSADNVGLKRDFHACFQPGSLKVVVPDNTNCLRILQGYKGEIMLKTDPEDTRIRACAVSPGGGKIAYGMEDGTVKVLELENDKIVSSKALIGHTDVVRCCKYTNNDKLLVTTSDDATIRIWQADGSSVVCEGHTDAVKWGLLFAKDTKLLSSSYDGTLKVWEVSSGKLLMTCEGHDEWILWADLAPDESKFLSASVDKTLKVWDAKDGHLISTLEGHQDCVRTCKFSPNGRHIASGDDEGLIKLWDGPTNLHTLSKHESWVTCIRFSGDGMKLVTVSDNIKWWDIRGRLLHTFHIRGSFVRYVQASYDFKSFVTIDSSGTLYILKLVEPD